MKLERWNQIEKLYEAARLLAAKEREAFLRDACGGDQELRQEVESLLRQEEEAQEFSESPAFDRAARELAEKNAPSLVGRRINSYQVLSLLGRGGMGEVYLAHDERLDRKLALKCLPAQLQQDTTARQRFVREAKSAAALDHPFICKIYEVGEVDENVFIAMEYVAGERFDQRLAKGALPLREALQKAVEIAEALEVAHRHHIVHRDLKPSNILLTLEGHAKVMDFGLAKRLEKDNSESELLTTSLTQTGMTLGTLAYMSPEQLRGAPVDTRSDIFSFGVVLYEMLTGVHPFRKPEAVETGHAILMGTPAPLSDHLDHAPFLLQHTLRKLLAKELERRYQHIADVRIDLEGLLRDLQSPAFGADAIEARPPGLAVRTWRRQMLTGLFVGGVATLAAFYLAVTYFAEAPMELPTRRFPLPLPEEMSFGRLNQPVISPDGRHVAFTGVDRESKQHLWIHSFDSLAARVLTATEGASLPFWSPDSRFIGFFADRQLKKIELSRGYVQSLCAAPGARGGTWNRDGVIVYGTNRDGLYRVSEAGGRPTPVTRLDRSRRHLSHRWPHFLPDGHSLLYTVEGPQGERGGLYLGSLDSEEGRLLSNDWSNAVYTSPGYLLFMREGILVVQPFDVKNLQATGPPVPLADQVYYAGTFGLGHFSTAEDGVLIYHPGADLTPRRLVWVDRQGQEEILALEPRLYSNLSLSPDGSRVAISVSEGGRDEIWIYDLVRDRPTRLTIDTSNDHPLGHDQPLWTPDGQRLVVTARDARGGGGDFFWKAADGTGRAERLTNRTNMRFPGSFSSDGKSLVFWEENFDNDKGYDVLLLRMEEKQAEPLLERSFDESRPAISPDGRWLAYDSNESGRHEVYVRPFPNLEDGQWMISDGGGVSAEWSPDGKELFYMHWEGADTGPRSTDPLGQRNRSLLRVKIQAEPSFSHGSPEVLFTGRYVTSLGRTYDVSPDGKRFLMIKPAGEALEASASDQLIVVLNWLEGLTRLVPGQSGTHP